MTYSLQNIYFIIKICIEKINIFKLDMAHEGRKKEESKGLFVNLKNYFNTIQNKINYISSQKNKLVHLNSIWFETNLN